MRSLVRRTWLAIAAIPLVVLATSHAAFADNGEAWAADHAAVTYFFDSGDYVTVCDMAYDHHGALGWIEVKRREASTVKIVSCLQDGRYGRPWNCGFTYVSG